MMPKMLVNGTDDDDEHENHNYAALTHNRPPLASILSFHSSVSSCSRMERAQVEHRHNCCSRRAHSVFPTNPGEKVPISRRADNKKEEEDLLVSM